MIISVSEEVRPEESVVYGKSLGLNTKFKHKTFLLLMLKVSDD